jgi:DNA-directed RNA polymerase subunit E'/Rpb7
MNRQYRKREKTELQYSKSIIQKNICLPMKLVGKNIAEIIEKNLVENYEGKCIVEGYVKNKSIQVINYSSGIVDGDNIVFSVVFQCDIYFPVANMKISCVVKNVTKAGIRGESDSEKPSPFVVFIARDFQYNIPYFQNLKEGDKFTARIIGQRFELNDKYISIIAEVIVPKDKQQAQLVF